MQPLSRDFRALRSAGGETLSAAALLTFPRNLRAFIKFAAAGGAIPEGIMIDVHDDLQPVATAHGFGAVGEEAFRHERERVGTAYGRWNSWPELAIRRRPAMADRRSPPPAP
jgi:hypothetical protein